MNNSNLSKEWIFTNLIKPAFTTCFPLKETEITLDKNIKKDLKLDSLDMLDLLFEIEELYQEELVTTDEEKKLFYNSLNGTVSDLVDIIYNLIDRRINNVQS